MVTCKKQKSIQYTKQSGFTLIELLVVISIIGLLASIISVSLHNARIKGRDSKRIQDFQQLALAFQLYYDKNNSMPVGHNCWTIPCDPNDNYFGACDAPLPDVPGGSDTMLNPSAYNSVMQNLVDAGLLTTIAHSPGGPGYCFFNQTGFDPSTGIGPAIFLVTQLEATPPSTIGLAPSVRPYNATDSNWCTKRLSTEYCFINQY